ncbi:MAG: phosphoribosylglycinamide formyltransferase [Acidobacteria bacterium]|nr:MAG: phosphoribosylglycinamide formyltransferase [Acidobacteriota bacterium]REK12158.1 MAG: phosphoribosylglycinamide formyltransferase [Acidobacteriota bacterium]
MGVLLSGRGSNFLALQQAISRGDLSAEIAVVVSNRDDASGLDAARRLGLPAVAVPKIGGASRHDHEQQVLAVLEDASVDWICLAGYMRLLSAEFVARFPRRIVNIHPSLLPSFPGLRVHEQVIEHGSRVSGCTVHLVDAGLDSGPIVRQTPVAVASDDDADSLAARVLAAEHDTYWRAMRDLTTRHWVLRGRRLCFLDGEPEGWPGA